MKGHKLLARIIPIGLEYEKRLSEVFRHSDLAIAQRLGISANLPKLEQ
jgi:hypothetical protein